MKLVPIVVTTCAVALGLAIDGSAQKRPTGPAGRGGSPDAPVILDATKPPDQSLTLDVVEVVGCAGAGPNNTFVLTHGTAPVKGGTASTTKAAIEAAKTKPLGTAQYVLIGAAEWNPASHNGHKVVAKGLLIKDAKETRLNVTSFQMLAPTCP